jgi:hypothetical protein
MTKSAAVKRAKPKTIGKGGIHQGGRTPATNLIEAHDWQTIWQVMAHLSMVDSLGGCEYERRTAEMLERGDLIERDGRLYVRGPIEEEPPETAAGEGGKAA